MTTLMNPITIDAWTFDVGTDSSSIEGYVEACARRVEQSWDGGASLVLFPEYTWAGLEPLLPAGAGLRGVAQAFWQRIMPGLHQRLSRAGKAVVLGTAPFLDGITGKLVNRAPVIVNGTLITQDKLFLTPWERVFQRGDAVRIFEFEGMRIAVLICLDIEVPELSSLLRGQGIDLILVPSATESILGCERITRCASARAVELGCAVVVSPLVGRCASELVQRPHACRKARFIMTVSTVQAFLWRSIC
jgi:predicted amidohydrolase